MLENLDARAARRWALSSLAALGRAREEIDALNVFPVPDGDTGTNLYLTVESACAAVLELPTDADLRSVSDTFARGALLGARGNSGIIAAQLLRGWADVLGERGVMDAEAAAEAMARADAQAWAAVAEPVEGTILSVSRAASQAAATQVITFQTARDVTGSRLGDVVAVAAQAAREALARTPEQLETLRRAGVVDAGGRGLVVILDTLDDLVHGRAHRTGAREQRRATLPAADLSHCTDLSAGGPAYEVMYLLEVDAENAPDAVPELRRRLAPLGNSLVVVGGGTLWHVHVHVDDPGAAVEVGIEAGRPHRVRITHFADEIVRRGPDTPRVRVGLVACAAGPGLADLFTQAGALVVPGGPGWRPSTGQILDAVRATHAEAVIVLPNDPDTLSVAEAAAGVARDDGIRVTVIPTRAQVQGLAAAAVHDPGRRIEDDVVRMSTAAAAARDGAVTIAAREAITTAGVCKPGDALGVVQGDFAVVGTDLGQVAVEVVDRLLSGGGELVTLVTGADADERLAKVVTDHLHDTRRDVEVSVLVGGQPRYLLLVGVE